MKKLSIILMSGCMALSAGATFAMDDMKKPDGMAKGGMMKKDTMTMQQCNDHIAMAKPGMKKDDAMMKKDTMCADMMKDGTGTKNKDSMMKPDGMASAPMKK